jgi:hypothetical protein
MNKTRHLRALANPHNAARRVVRQTLTAGLVVDNAAIAAILLSLHLGTTSQDLNDAGEQIHALLYPNGCPGGGCEDCVARLAQ